MSSVTGSLFRRILFWAHLSSAISAGLFILLMSVTGVLLTYEHQMVDRAAHRNHVTAGGAQLLNADRLAQIARESSPGGRPSLVFEADPTAPVTVSRGRDGSLLLDPRDGAVIRDAAAGQREFFRVVENWHRRLAGDNNNSTRAKLIDYGNLLFLFIITSGVYIWLPHAWRWRNLRGLIFFQTRYVNSKVRDFNWHHVLGFWMLIPLFVISLSGVVMSFDWANRLVYAAYGEEAPQRRAAPGGAGNAGGPIAPGGERGNERAARNRDNVPAEPTGSRASLESLRQAAIAVTPGWRRLTLPVATDGTQVEISLELESTERRAPRQTVLLATADAAVIRVQPPQDTAQTPGQKARGWMRFAHTGEQYGIVGQTIAGIASLAACFLAYTGLALAWRRLIRPLFRRDENA